MNTPDDVNEVAEVEAPVVSEAVEAEETATPVAPKKTTRKKRASTSKKSPISAPAPEPVVEAPVEALPKKKIKTAETDTPRVTNRRRN